MATYTVGNADGTPFADSGTTSSDSTDGADSCSHTLAQANAIGEPVIIDVVSDVTLSGPLSPICNPNLTINGNRHTIDAGRNTRIFMAGMDQAVGTAHARTPAVGMKEPSPTSSHRQQPALSTLDLRGGTARGVAHTSAEANLSTLAGHRGQEGNYVSRTATDSWAGIPSGPVRAAGDPAAAWRSQVDAAVRIEHCLTATLAQIDDGPPLLAAAMRHAVFPRGARLRPRLCYAVAAACADPVPDLIDAAAVAIELLHCASLVHDDLPCFDAAPTRRGLPSVQAAFGVPLAVLAGDALIVLAFQALGRCAAVRPERLACLVSTIAAAAGAPGGIAAGQAWECEPALDLVRYQRAKTGALFSASAMAGAAASGEPAEPWRELGEQLGEAYQVADDIADAAGRPEVLGKPVGRDAALDRPNAASALGLDGALALVEARVRSALAAIPPCRGDTAALRLFAAQEFRRLIPGELATRMA